MDFSGRISSQVCSEPKTFGRGGGGSGVFPIRALNYWLDFSCNNSLLSCHKNCWKKGGVIGRLLVLVCVHSLVYKLSPNKLEFSEWVKTFTHTTSILPNDSLGFTEWLYVSLRQWSYANPMQNVRVLLSKEKVSKFYAPSNLFFNLRKTCFCSKAYKVSRFYSKWS